VISCLAADTVKAASSPSSTCQCGPNLESAAKRFTVFAAAIVLAVGGAAIEAQQPAAPAVAPPLPTLVKLKEDVYVVQNVNSIAAEIGPNGGNATVYVTGGGVILVDAKNERMHDDIVAKVRSITDQPIKYVILTHNHADHSGGAPRFQADGVTVVSSFGTRELMDMGKLPGAAQVTYSGEGRVMLGGKQALLQEYRGHTRGDTVVSLPAARVVVAGDLVVTGGMIPNIVNYGDGGGWTDLGRTLDEVAKLDFDMLVPGHGPSITKQEFLQFRDRVAGIRERFRTLNRERKTAEEIAQTLVKEFNWGTGPAAGNILGMLQELR
jgi:glyoxylase-like metal-dependent hydrolase (beta-lactamase superfamily II)